MTSLFPKQLFYLNHFIAYSILVLLTTMPALRLLAGPGYLIPILIAFLLVYIFKLVPAYTGSGWWKVGYYGGQGLVGLGNMAVILSIGVPVLWSNLVNNSDLLLLLWLTIPALAIALPCWIIGVLLVWICGRRQPSVSAAA